MALLGSAFFAGWAVGAPLCSSLADKLGRKTLTLRVLPVAVLVGILPMLPDRRKHPNIILRFCCPLCLGLCVYLLLGAIHRWVWLLLPLAQFWPGCQR